MMKRPENFVPILLLPFFFFAAALHRSLGIVAAALLLVFFLRSRTRPKLSPAVAALALLVLFRFASNPTLRPFAFPIYLAPWLIFHLGRRAQTFSSATLARTTAAFLVGLSVIQIIGLGEIYGLWRDIAFYSFDSLYDNHVFIGATKNSMQAAVLAGHGALFALALLVRGDRRPWRQILLLACLLLSLLALRHTARRSAWLFFPMALFTMALVARSARLRLGAIVIVLLTCASVLLVPQIRERLHSIADPMYKSNRDRAVLWAESIEIFRENPWVGIGFHGLLEETTRRARADDGPIFNHAHNQYLTVLAETGAVGLFIYLAFLFLLLRDLHRAAVRSSGGRELQAAIIGGLVWILLGDCFERSMAVVESLTPLSFFWGMVAAGEVAAPGTDKLSEPVTP